MTDDSSHTVFLIDDDPAVRRSISLLLKAAGYHAEAFESATAFLQSDNYSGTGCIVLDIFINEESGLELQDAIAYRFRNLPIIYITGHGDIPMSVKALKKGAINFLLKPIEAFQLLAAIDEAFLLSQEKVNLLNEFNKYKQLIDTLTNRELEVFQNVISGLLNKQIAAKLNIAEQTVKLHRGRITEKLGVKSVAELVTIADKLNIKASF